jgi:Tfp pilus assembly protein PilV
MKLKQLFSNRVSDGFSIIEVIVAMGLFVTIAVLGVVTVAGSFSTNRLGDEETEARILAQQGIEVARSLKNQGWTSPFLATNCTSGCGVAAPSSAYTWSGSNNVIGKYTRTIAVNDVQRSISGAIVSSGGTVDADTKKVTSTVNWSFTPTRSNSVQLVTYLTNFRKSIGGLWANPTLQSSLDLSGNGNGLKVQVEGNYAYVITSTSPNFRVIDISNPASPVQVGSLNLVSAPTNLYVANNFAYVSSTNNSAELMIVNVSNPSTPLLTGIYNDSGNEDANGVYVVGTTVYLALNGGNDLVIVNASVPALPTFLGGLTLNGGAAEIAVLGSFAYIASNDNSQELQVVNVTTPASPTLAGTLNLATNSDASSINSVGSYVYIAQGSNLHVVNVVTPTAPALSGTLATVGTISDIALNLANTDTYLFLATTDNSQEFQVVNVATPATPTLLSFVDIAGTSDLLGVAYSSALDRAVVVGAAATAEVRVIQP